MHSMVRWYVKAKKEAVSVHTAGHEEERLAIAAR